MRWMRMCVRWKISLSERTLSQASQLPHLECSPLWERACSRKRQKQHPCIHCIKPSPQMHLPAPHPNGEKNHLSSVR
jgi:hypothetical protein